MENQEVFTIRSLKKGAMLCLKLTLLFGVIFSVIFRQTTLYGIAVSFGISGLYCFGLAFGHGIINNY